MFVFAFKRNTNKFLLLCKVLKQTNWGAEEVFHPPANVLSSFGPHEQVHPLQVRAGAQQFLNQYLAHEAGAASHQHLAAPVELGDRTLAATHPVNNQILSYPEEYLRKRKHAHWASEFAAR